MFWETAFWNYTKVYVLCKILLIEKDLVSSDIMLSDRIYLGSNCANFMLFVFESYTSDDLDLRESINE